MRHLILCSAAVAAALSGPAWAGDKVLTAPLPAWVTPWMRSEPTKGPYSRTISAARAVAWGLFLPVLRFMALLLCGAGSQRDEATLLNRERSGE